MKDVKRWNDGRGFIKSRIFLLNDELFIFHEDFLSLVGIETCDNTDYMLFLGEVEPYTLNLIMRNAEYIGDL